MDEATLRKRLRLGEDSETELKSLAHDGFQLTDGLQKKVAKTLTAFANGRGGVLILGVEDDGTPTGLGDAKTADKVSRQITQLCQTRIDPTLVCQTNKEVIDDKLLLVVEVPEWSPNRPHQTDSRYYLRDGAQSREATRDELMRMLQSQAVHFDEQVVRGATREDLDPAEIRRVFDKLYPDTDVEDEEAYLHALKCLDRGQPTVTGILFFGRDPQRFFPDARILAVRFPEDGSLETMKNSTDIRGTIFQQIEAIEKWLSVMVPSPSKVEGWERKELGIPSRVLREAIHNALAHRDYNMTSQVNVFVYKDRLTVLNPGILLNRLTIESIKLAGIQQRRNATITAIIARGGRQESAGVGIPRMFDMMRKAGLPEPEIEIVGGHFQLTLRWKDVEGSA
ncbi:MAG: ATP-binding protein [Polyangiaceae bacterium]